MHTSKCWQVMTSFALQMIDNDQSAPQELWSTNACHIVNNSGHFVSNQNKVKPLTASVTFFWVASQNLKITRSRKSRQSKDSSQATYVEHHVPIFRDGNCKSLLPTVPCCSAYLFCSTTPPCPESYPKRDL